MIEFCCSHDSNLRTLREAGKGCRLIQVTEKEGGTTQGCRNWLAQEVQSFRENNPQGEVLLYASFPCVGGSPWGYINAMIDTGAERIEQQQKEFAKLFKSLRVAAAGGATPRLDPAKAPRLDPPLALWAAAAFCVAGAVHRASWRSCGARGRRWPAVPFCVAGAV